MMEELWISCEWILGYEMKVDSPTFYPQATHILWKTYKMTFRVFNFLIKKAKID